MNLMIYSSPLRITFMVVYIFITNKDISFYIQTGHIQPIATIFTADHTVARLNTSDMVQLQHSHSHKSTVLGDAPHRPTSPLIFLHHLCIFLLIVASPRRSALVALTSEKDLPED